MMKCCKECPEYDTCNEKAGCCDMCDFYNPKTNKCAYIKKKGGEEILSRRKLDEKDESEIVDDNGMEEFEDTYDDMNPYEEDDIDDFFNT